MPLDLRQRAKPVDHGQIAREQHEIGHLTHARGERLHPVGGGRDREPRLAQGRRQPLEEARLRVGDHDAANHGRHALRASRDQPRDDLGELTVRGPQRLAQLEPDAREAAHRTPVGGRQRMRDTRRGDDATRAGRERDANEPADLDGRDHLVGRPHEEPGRRQVVDVDDVPRAVHEDLRGQVHRVTISLAAHGPTWLRE